MTVRASRRLRYHTGPILVDSPEGIELGLAADAWSPSSYLFKRGGEVYLSVLLAATPRSGALTRLVARVEELGFTVAIPTPLSTMESILKRWGWTPRREWSEGHQAWSEVWRRPSPGKALHEPLSPQHGVVLDLDP